MEIPLNKTLYKGYTVKQFGIKKGKNNRFTLFYYWFISWDAINERANIVISITSGLVWRTDRIIDSLGR